MDDDDFVRFWPPCQNPEGEWYIRAIEQEDDGSYYFLAFDQPKGAPPRIAKVHEPFQLTCEDESEADFELAVYYRYHGCPELYEALPKKIIGSQIMEFE